MASSSKDTGLPRHWIKKASRKYPSLSYYVNIKTGETTWTHPSLHKDGDVKDQEDVKSSKKSSKQKNVTATKTVKQGAFQAAKASLKQPQKAPISTASVSSQDSEESQISIARSPVKFAIKKQKNAVLTPTGKGNSLKKQVAIHPSILSAQKVAARVHWSKRKKKMGKCSDRDKTLTTEEQESAKKTSAKHQEDSVLPSIATKRDVSPDTDHKHKDEERPVENKMTVGGRKILQASRKKNAKADKEQGIINDIIEELTSSPSRDEDKPAVQNKDEKKTRNIFSKSKEFLMYNDFLLSKRYSSSKKKAQCPDNTSQNNTLPAPDKSRLSHQVIHTLQEEEEELSVPSKGEACEGAARPTLYHAGNTPLLHATKVLKPVSESCETEVILSGASDMEIDEQEVITEIANFRVTINRPGSASCSHLPTFDSSQSPTSVYFVVDTNILIQDVNFLELLKSAEIASQEVVVVIPYIALQEMDGLKKSASIGHACQAAIRWCNRNFEVGDPRVQGQSYNNYQKTLAKNPGASGDDLVRDCCLLMAQEGLDVCLLTNDINLRNKAFMSNVAAIGIRDLKKKLENGAHMSLVLDSQCLPAREESQMNCASPDYVVDSADIHNDRVAVLQEQGYAPSVVSFKPNMSIGRPPKKRRSSSSSSEGKMLLQEISASLLHTLGNILQDRMKEVYEDLWLTIVKHKPPWRLQEVFSCWEKHWIAVMVDKFPREMKECLIDVKHAIFSSNVTNAQKVLEKVRFLYQHFEREPFQKHILPIPQNLPPVADMTEVLPSSPAPALPSTVSSPEADNRAVDDYEATPSHQHSAFNGVANVEKMINQVGAHIIHFIAMVLDAYGVQHTLPTLSSSRSMTPDDARGSGINLHKVTMTLGTSIARCLSERSSSALQELGHLLVNFWAEAKAPCPSLPFTESDLSQFIESPSGQQYLECVLRELESLVQSLTSVLGS